MTQGQLITTLAMLIKRGVITVDPADAQECCGLPRDVDGFCQNNGSNHPIYVRMD